MVLSLSQKRLSRYSHLAASIFTNAFACTGPLYLKPVHDYLDHRGGDRWVINPI